MSFKWDEPKSVEIFDPGTKQARRDKATPSYIIHHPYGFRQEDIVHSLTIAVGELIDVAQAQAQSIQNFEALKEIQNAQEETETENQQGQGSPDGEDTAEHSPEIESASEKRGSISESPNL